MCIEAEVHSKRGKCCLYMRKREGSTKTRILYRGICGDRVIPFVIEDMFVAIRWMHVTRTRSMTRKSVTQDNKTRQRVSGRWRKYFFPCRILFINWIRRAYSSLTHSLRELMNYNPCGGMNSRKNQFTRLMLNQKTRGHPNHKISSRRKMKFIRRSECYTAW